MTAHLRVLAAAGSLAVALLSAETASTQEQGGILKIHHRDSPPSLSILEEVTISTVLPMMGLFNNLVMYKHCCPVKPGSPARNGMILNGVSSI
jgi:hypothetical protein